MSVHPLGGSRLPNAARPRAVGIVMRDTEATETGVVGSLVVGMSVARAVTTRIAVVTSVASGGGIGTRVAGRTGIGAAIVASPDARPDAGRIAAVATTTTAATTATTAATTATTGDTAAVVGIVMRDTEATETGVVGSLVVGMSVARAVTTRIAVVTSVASGGGIGTRVAGRTGIGAAIVASPDARPDAGRIAAVATTTTAATTATTAATTATTGDTAAVVGIVMRDTEATETGEAALRDATPWSPNRCRPETSTRNPDAGSPA